MNKEDFFKNELELINVDELKKYAQSLILTFPDYFFEVPASSTGKFHPKYALGEGGLYRHTRALVGILNHMFQLEQTNFSDRRKCLLIIAGIAHDSFKSGKTKTQYTVKNHPELASQNIKEFNSTNDYKLNEDELTFLCKAVESHMGQWSNPKPFTESEKILHLADYLASRKNLEYLFDEPAAGAVKETTKEVLNENTDDILLPFGKYSNTMVSEIYKVNPGYVKWMSESMKEPYKTIAGKVINKNGSN